MPTQITQLPGPIFDKEAGGRKMPLAMSTLWLGIHLSGMRAGAVLASLLFVAQVHGQPVWPQFRGPTGQGVAPTAHPPVSFAKSNALWSVAVPPGHSSPVVWANKIFLTSCEGSKLECRAYNRMNGQLLWAKPVPVEKLEETHPFNNSASATAVADSKVVIFYFGSYGLLAFGHDGTDLWEKKLPMQVSRGRYGSGTSPILWDDLVILALDTDKGESRLLALKRATGKIAWETPRPLFRAGWSTPVIWTRKKHSEIVLLGSKALSSYNPADGQEIWTVPGFTIETAASPTCDGDRVYACSAGIGGRSSLHFDLSFWSQLQKFDSNHDGKIQIEEVPEDFLLVQRPELPEGHPGRLFPVNVKGMLKNMDEDKDGAVSEQEWTQRIEAMEKSDVPVLMAVRGGSFTNSEQRVAWKYGRGIPEIPSLLAYEGKLFMIRDGGLLQCLDAASGSLLYQERIGVDGGYAASPVAAQGHVYLASQSGTITVIDARANRLDVLARNPLEEQMTATPALVEGRIYIRTAGHLIAFGRK